MNSLVLGSLATAGLIQLALGVRLLWLTRQTRGTPELLFGLAWFVPAVENALFATGLAIDAPDAKISLAAASRIMGATSVLVLFVAGWRLFRPEARWLRPLIGVVACVLMAAWFWQLSGPGLGAHFSDSPLVLAISTTRWLALVWLSGEAWRFYRMFLQRWRLGLSERLFADRFLMWAGSASAMSAFAAIELSRHLWPNLPALWSASQPVLSLGAVIVMWAAFFPPDWLRQRAERMVP